MGTSTDWLSMRRNDDKRWESWALGIIKSLVRDFSSSDIYSSWNNSSFKSSCNLLRSKDDCESKWYTDWPDTWANRPMVSLVFSGGSWSIICHLVKLSEEHDHTKTTPWQQSDSQHLSCHWGARRCFNLGIGKETVQQLSRIYRCIWNASHNASDQWLASRKANQ